MNLTAQIALGMSVAELYQTCLVRLTEKKIFKSRDIGLDSRKDHSRMSNGLVRQHQTSGHKDRRLGWGVGSGGGVTQTEPTPIVCWESGDNAGQR